MVGLQDFKGLTPLVGAHPRVRPAWADTEVCPYPTKSQRANIVSGEIIVKREEMHFPAATAFLGKIVTAKIDRPLHSKHPDWAFTYPVNYGYLPGVPAPDGEDLDVYVLNISVPLQVFTGQCIAVIQRLNDNDDKLVLALPGHKLTNEQIREQTNFQEQFFESIIIR